MPDWGRLMRRFAQPPWADQSGDATAAHAEEEDDVERRLIAVEERQQIIAARLRLLERQSNPRGVPYDGG